MWFAKNSDRHPDEAQVVEWHAARPASTSGLPTQYLTLPDADAFGFCGSRPTWLWGCEHGVNEHGVAVGNEKIWTTGNPNEQPRALLGMDIVRLILERARTADDALAVCTSMLEEYGQGGSGEPHADEPYYSSFLMADARAGWIVETSNRTWAAQPVGAGASISNRMSITTNWTRASTDVGSGTNFDTYRHPKMPVEIADGRLAATAACVARGPRTGPAEIAAVLRDHTDNGSGFTVCMHAPEFHAQTTASMIVDLPSDERPVRAWACLGNPCTSVYVPIFPPSVPAALGDAATWHRFASLREEAITTMQALEKELWAAADDAYATGTRAALDRFTEQCWADVERALQR
jgi:hypothetical protein